MQEDLSIRRWIDGDDEGLERLDGRFFLLLAAKKNEGFRNN